MIIAHFLTSGFSVVLCIRENRFKAIFCKVAIFFVVFTAQVSDIHSRCFGIDLDDYVVSGIVKNTCDPLTDVVISIVSSISPLCFDSFDGNIVVAAAGGEAPYTYALNGGIFGMETNFTDLDQGDYTVTVMDQLGNTSSVSVTLDSPPILGNTLLNRIDNLCFGGFQGSVEVIGSGGTSNSGYFYSINGGPIQSNGLFTDLSNGFYVISVFDDNNCEAQVTAEIESPLDILATITNVIDVSCSGASDGSAMVFVSGGVGGFSFSLDDADFDDFDSFQNLDAGLHTIIVQDANGCFESVSFMTLAPDALSIDTDITNLTCSGDSSGVVVFNIGGGVGPYSYLFLSGVPDTIGVYTGLNAGSYGIEVVDQNGCLVMDSIEIMEPPVLEIEIVTNTSASCGGEGFVVFNNISGLGDINYSIDDLPIASDTFKAEFGIYEVLAIDSAGCSTTLDFEIEQLSNLSIGVDTIINVSCFGELDGSIIITNDVGEGPLTYSLDGEEASASSVFDSLTAGNYIVSVMDSSGCTASTLITISEPEPLELQIEELIGAACFGDETGSLNGSINGGTGDFTLQSSNGHGRLDTNSVIIDSLSEGEVYITLQDAQGCILNDTIRIDGNPQLQVSIDSVASVNCAEGRMGYVSLSGSGGLAPYNFESNGVVSDGVFDGLIADDYTVIIEDSLGCSTSTDVNIGMLGSLIITGTGFSDVSCFGGDDGLYVLNIPNYIGDILWSINGVSNPDSNFMNLEAGQHTLMAIDSFDCSVSLDINIDEPEELTGAIMNEGGGTITILADGGTEPYLYVINGQITFQDSPVFTDLEEGSYVFTIIDANGCEFNLDQIITDVNNLVFGQLVISPNPAFDLITIAYENKPLGQVDIEILDMNGRSIQTSIINRNQNSTTINLEDIPRGTYLVKVVDGGAFVVKRFVKM